MQKGGYHEDAANIRNHLVGLKMRKSALNSLSHSQKSTILQESQSIFFVVCNLHFRFMKSMSSNKETKRKEKITTEQFIYSL